MISIDISARPLGDALAEFGKQAKLTVVFYAEDLGKNVSAKALTGTFTADAALAKLLSNTGLSYEYLDERTVAIRSTKAGSSSSGVGPADQMRVADAAKSASAFEVESSAGDTEKDQKNSIVVKDKRIGPFASPNVDLPRSADDAQAYYIFDTKTIEESGAVSIEEFLRNRLTMNTSPALAAQRDITAGPGASAGYGNISTVTLRGLSADQTLILVNGRRRASVNTSINGDTPTGQPDLNGIPLAAIDRIEVLPASASGIYGGNALGGVINVILKRDYTGAEVRAVYGNTFDTDAANRTLGLTAGSSLEGGRTSLTFSGSYADAGSLLVRDRQDIFQKNIATLLHNNPQYFISNSAPRFFGTTPNIGSASSTNLTLKDGTPLNSTITSVPAGYAGPQSDGGAGLVANAGNYNLQLPDTRQAPNGLLYPLQLAPVVKSVSFDARRKMTPWLEIFAEYSRSTNEVSAFVDPYFSLRFPILASAPTNPFNQNVYVAVPQDIQLPYSIDNVGSSFTGGFALQLPRDWRVEGDVTRNGNDSRWFIRSVSVHVADTSADANLNPFRDTAVYPLDLGRYILTSRRSFPSYLDGFALRAAGPVWPLPAGAVTLALSVESRKEGNGDAWAAFTATPTQPASLTVYPSQSQTVRSAYAEINVPVITAINSLPGLRQLDIQLAGRRDEYATQVRTQVLFEPADPSISSRSSYSSQNPTLGLRWKPVAGLMFRASYARGFRPPSYNLLLPGEPYGFPIDSVVDPRREDALTGIDEVSGGNPDLQPETSETLAAGIILEPAMLQGLRLSVDYTHIKKHNAIGGLDAQTIVNNEQHYPGRVVRDPPLPGDPSGVGIITLVDVSPLNLNLEEVESYDIAANYRVAPASGSGTFEFYALATLLEHLRQQFVYQGPFVEQVNAPGSPVLKFKGNAGMSWERGCLTVGWAARYTPSYPVYGFQVVSQGAARVASQTYHDIFARYRFETAGRETSRAYGWLDGTDVQVGIKNVFDTIPPFDSARGPGFYSTYGDARLREYSVSIRKRF